MHAGLLGLIALPIFRVGAALIAFAEQPDPALLATTGAVLALLAWSFQLAGGF